MIDVSTAADLAGVRPNTIRQWIRRGHLRGFRRRTIMGNGRTGWATFIDERELLVAEQATRQRGGVHAA